MEAELDALVKKWESEGQHVEEIEAVLRNKADQVSDDDVYGGRET